MTSGQVFQLFAAVLTTLHEVGTGCPESTIYLALGMNMDVYLAIRNLMVASKLITVKGNYITITAKGHEMAIKCNEAVAGK
jgi:hypothetical protein